MYTRHRPSGGDHVSTRTELTRRGTNPVFLARLSGEKQIRMAVRIKRRHWDDYSGAVTLSVSFRNSFSVAPSSFFPPACSSSGNNVNILSAAFDLLTNIFRHAYSTCRCCSRPNVAIDIENFYSKNTPLILTLLALELKFTLQKIFLWNPYKRIICHFCCWILIYLDNIELVPNLFR